MRNLHRAELSPVTAASEQSPTADPVLRQLEAAREADRAHRLRRRTHLERLLPRFGRVYVPLASAAAGIVALLLVLGLMAAINLKFRFWIGDGLSTGPWWTTFRSPWYFFGALITQNVASAVARERMLRWQAALQKELAEYVAEEAA